MTTINIKDIPVIIDATSHIHDQAKLTQRRRRQKNRKKTGDPVVIVPAPHQNPNGPGHSFQCNCACPEDGFSLVQTHVAADQLLQRTPRVFEQRLDDQFVSLFNPGHDSCVSVINDAASELWRSFDAPRKPRPEDHPDAVQALIGAGLLTAPGTTHVPAKRAPKSLSTWIHVTNECNLRCDYCYVNKSNDDMPEHIGRAAVDAILRSARKHAFDRVKLKFAGGEATLNMKRVFDIHHYAKRAVAETGIAIESTVLSNGVSIGERSIERFISEGIQTSISLDGVGDVHDAQRKFRGGQGSFRSVARTIDRLIERGIHPFISITLSGRNAIGLADTVRFVMERGLHFNINFYRDNECSTHVPDLKLQDEAIIRAMHAAFDEIERCVPEHSLLGNLVDRAQFNQPHDKACSVGDSYIVVDHAGNVAKCQMEIEQPIGTVFAEDPLLLIRQDSSGIQNVGVDEKAGCRECEWKYWCAGGCPALTFRATGRFDVKSPNCHIYKAIYPRAVRLEGLRLRNLYQKNAQHVSLS
jgi:uncharacterized protein